MSDYQSGASAMRRFRHKKRGTTYRVIGIGQIQSDVSLTDSEYVVIYQSELQGHFWARRLSEFEDGRFEELPADPASNEGADELTLSLEGCSSGVSDVEHAAAISKTLETYTSLVAIIATRDAEIATLRAALEKIAGSTPWTAFDKAEIARQALGK